MDLLINSFVMIKTLKHKIFKIIYIIYIYNNKKTRIYLLHYILITRNIV